MRQRTTLQKALLLTVFGAAIASACVVGSDSDGVDDNDGGSSNTGGKAAGGSGGKAGSSSTAGTTSGGGDTGTAGDTGTGGASGGAPPDMTPTCDPAETGGQGGGSMVVGTPYPDCSPTDSGDDCQTCLEQNCCEEYKNCNAYEPYNVCGWGGPDDWPSTGGEFLCWQACINSQYDASGAGGGGGATSDIVTAEMSDECLFDCGTPDCSGLPGDETLAIAECVLNSCDTVCFE